MSIALGREPEGTKERAGDMRTPEGSYRVANRPRGSRFHLFIPIDYPSPVDAERALTAGIISWSTYETIWDASESGELPPQESPLGGHLGLHGEGERWAGDSPYIDWTNGCVAMSDAHIEFLADRIEVGTPVLILP
jgi:murein L,D-transpeptidase YafK